MADVIRSPRPWWLSPRVRVIASGLAVSAGLVIAVTVGTGASSLGWLMTLFVASLVLAIAWVAAGWRSGILALGVITLLPVVGVLRVLHQEDAGDILAISAFFMLLAAVVGEAVARRVGVGRSSTSTSIAASSPTSVSWRSRGWRSRIDLIVVLAICLVVPQTWLSSGSLLAFGDFAPLSFLRPEVAAAKLYPLWSTFSEGLGGRNFTVVNAPLVFLSELLQNAALSGPMTQRVIFTGLLVCQGAGIVYLLRLVWPSSRPAARIAGGLFYTFNVLALFSLPGLVQMTAFALMPMLTVFMLKGLRSGRSIYVMLFAIGSAGLAYVGANPPLVLVVGLASLLVSTIIHQCSGGSFRSMLWFLARALPLSALVNAWWIVPLLLSLGAGGASHIPVTPDQWNWTHVRNSVSNLFTLNTNWAWPQKIYYPYSDAYEGPLLQVAVFIPAVLAFGSLAVKGKRNVRPASWLVFACLVMFFVGKGVHEPFGTVNEFLLTEVPGMWLLREPAAKLLPIVVLVFALLICFTVDNALRNSAERPDRLRSWTWRSVGAVGLALPLLAFPILTGEFAWGERPILPDARTRVPDYWYRAADALAEEPSSGAVLLLPLDDFYAMPYNWGYYGPDSVPVELIRRPTIMGGQLTYLSYGAASPGPREQLQQALVDWDYAKVSRLLDGLGVGYVLVRGDIDYDVLGRLGRWAPSPEALAPMLDESPLFEAIGRFGPLALYRVADPRNGPISAWPAYATSPQDDALPADEVLYSAQETVVLNGAAPEAEGDEADSEPPLERLPLALNQDGVESDRRGVSLVWDGSGSEGEQASHYLRDPHGRLRKIGFGPDGRIDLLMPWGRSGLLDIWATTDELISDPSFERNGLRGWRELAGCRGARAMSRSRAPIQATLSPHTPFGRSAMLINGRNHAGCVARVVGVEAGGIFEISLSYRTHRGREPAYCIFNPTEAHGRCLERRALPTSRGWRTFVDTFTVTEPLAGARLFLFPGGSGPGPAAVEFDRVQINRLERDRVFAVDWSRIGQGSGGAAPGTERQSRYDVDVDASAARYVVRVKGADDPFVLTLNQTFDPAWVLMTVAGRDLDSTQTVVNGFANGWVVRGGEDEFVVEFSLDRWIVYARWISVITGLALLMSLLASRRPVGAKLRAFAPSSLRKRREYEGV
jgi:hypothetical protein